MNKRYQNETCAVCGNSLDGDIVVCPDCGTPLHRTCWNENGGCPHAQRHGEFLWQPETPEEPSPTAFDAQRDAGTVCPVCGENCPMEAARCPNCDTHFAQYAAAQQRQFMGQGMQMQREPVVFSVNHRQVGEGELIGDRTNGDVVAVEEAALHLRGSRRTVERYLSRFERSRPLGWNWAAFLFGPYWLFFRKLYKAGIALAGIILALNFAVLVSGTGVKFQADLESAAATATQLQAEFSEALRANDTEATSAATSAMSATLLQLLRNNKWYIVIQAAVFLLPRIATALMADWLLRRKVWRDIGIAHEDSGGESPEQKFGRQRILVRRGGMSVFAPVAFFWANMYIPNLLIMIIERLAT